MIAELRSRTTSSPASPPATSGAEAGFEVKISPTLTANAALALGQYQYANNPSYIQSIDNSNEIVDRDRIYWKGLNVSGTPQTAATLGLTYYSPWYANFGDQCELLRAQLRLDVACHPHRPRAHLA